MKRNIAAIVLVFILCASIPPVTGAPVLECGTDEVIVVLAAPVFYDAISLSVPSDKHVLHTTMNVSVVASGGSQSEYPEGVSLLVNDSTVWAFQGTGYGHLGMQDVFSNGTDNARLTVGSGGTAPPALRLPQNALVTNANMELNSTPLRGWRLMLNLTGAAADDRMGRSVSCAGDVNRDGFDDVVVGAQQNDAGGANAGRAYIFFGNRTMDNNADVIITGTTGERMGVSCSGAGDVNGDGYDDVIVGAHMNSTLGTDTGRACILFGGPLMDGIPDVIFAGPAAGDQFGIDVSGAGDLNNDSYDDVLVGGHLNDACGADAGRAYIYYGGQNMDNVADVVLNGSYADDRFGSAASMVRDLNGDGFDDVIVGASYNDSAASDAGAAYIFFGGTNMDSIADVNMSGTASADRFGVAVSGAGDMNRDGFGDVAVGSLNDDTIAVDAGAAFIFLGGKNMDSRADVNLYGTATTDKFGTAVSGVGDVNHDGFDDVIASSPDNDDAGTDFGKAYVFFGGLNIDSINDGNFTGAATDDGYGNCGRGGDTNGDGVDDILIGAPRNDAGGSNAGRAFIFSFNHPLLDASIDIMSNVLWKRTGYFNGTNVSSDISAQLNSCLALSGTAYTDNFGNKFADLQFKASAGNEGNITIRNMTVIYTYEAFVPDFGPKLNGYIETHDCPKDASGNLSVPLVVRSQNAGRVRLSGLDFSMDLAPAQVREIKTIEMDEDGMNASLIDLYPYFQDDYDADTALNFSLVCATNSSIVRLSLESNRYILADASTGPANDNWTGTVEAVVACADHRGQSIRSNSFTIMVRNVNDPPIITSTPKKSAEPGVPYFYNVTARDGDNDTVQFSMRTAPADMAIDAATGVVFWLPKAAGNHNVVVAVEDALSSAEQSFSVSVPNRPPRITSTPSLEARLGVPYVYNITAEDTNNDTIRFEIASGPGGMVVNPITGVLAWTPGVGGKFDVMIRASDGKERTIQNFSIMAIQENRAPQIRSVPGLNATVDILYIYNLSATDPDSDSISFSLESGPANMTVDASVGIVAWTPGTPGNFTVALKALDSNGAGARQEFIIKVSPAVRLRVVLTSPKVGETLRGETVFSGTVKKGTRELVGVQMRIDGTEWSDIGSDYSWNHTLDTSGLKNGRHIFELRAYDGNEYSDIVKAELNVNNPTVTSSKGFIPMLDAAAAALLVASAAGLSLLRRRRIG